MGAYVTIVNKDGAQIVERITEADRQEVAQASIKASASMRQVAHSIPNLSHLTLPQIDAVADLIGELIPAGNVPGVVLSGAARLKERVPQPQQVKRDIGLLFKGVERVLNKAAYWGVFGGAAAVILGYQNILKLAGKDANNAFPRGPWQFYVDYALREDTARHTTETHGFDTALRKHRMTLSPEDRATAWVMAVIRILHRYDALLENEWRERVYTYLLYEMTQEQPGAARYARLYTDWLKQRPYGRGSDTQPGMDYPADRHIKFDRFIREATTDLAPEIRRAWRKTIEQAEAEALPDYVDQMSILAYLQPEEYSETHITYPFQEAHMGIIRGGHYYLIPASDPATGGPASVDTVRQQIAAIWASQPGTPPAQLSNLAVIKRSALGEMRKKLHKGLRGALEKLRFAPVMMNFDDHDHELPLVEMRKGERGIGDHAMTIFDTGRTFAFDMSHIFFDGVWGATLAEILTNEALSWAVHLAARPTAVPSRPREPLTCHLTPADWRLVRKAPRVTPEVGAENTEADIAFMLRLRKLFKRRSDLIRLTVNDLLVLYRAVHAVTYQPDPALIAELETLSGERITCDAASAALEALRANENPAILIPVDGSWRAPHERLYPMAFEVPLRELNFLELYHGAAESLDAYKSGKGDRDALYKQFDEMQRRFLGTLAGFGEVMSRAKEIATQGESSGVGTIKLLAHLPGPLQNLMNAVPNRWDLLNDILKGREVFSNVGAVAKSSTLTRFVTAKDDNEKKTLAWGVITDAEGIMHISLRDFRPHVGMLQSVGQGELAARICRDYLNAYARGLNDFINALWRITISSRETRFTRLEDIIDESS